MDMPTDNPWTATPEDFDQKRQLAEGKSYVDIALQAAVGPNHRHIEALAKRGAISFEIFLAGGRPAFQVDSDDDYRGILNTIKELDAVAGITAGDPEMITRLIEETKSSGGRDILSFNSVRPPASETAGVTRACRMAAETGARIHFRQISCADSIEVLREYLDADNISAEVTPHNLVLTEDHAIRLGPFGAVIPPLRTGTDCNALLGALQTGEIDIVATDHAPHLREEKERGREDIWQVAPGLPGVQTFAPIMLNLASGDTFSLPDLVRTCAEKPAQLFGLYPQKGSLAVGSDADLIIVDQNATTLIRDADQLSKAGWTPFDGLTTQSRIERVLLRGQTVAHDGKLVGNPVGQFLRC